MGIVVKRCVNYAVRWVGVPKIGLVSNVVSNVRAESNYIGHGASHCYCWCFFSVSSVSSVYIY